MSSVKHLYALKDRHIWIEEDSETGRGLVIKGPVKNIEHEMHARFYKACPDGCLEPLVVTSLGAIYMGTELIRTGDLLDYLEVSTRQHQEYAYGFWDAKIYILAKMVYIGDRLEKCNMIHGDLSLENFVLGDNLDQLFLIDFGLSRSADNYKQHVVCGKPGYIAPELRSPVPPDYNPFGIDAYALGICFFYIVFGFAPYEVIGDNLFCTLTDSGLSGLYDALHIDTTKVPRVFLRLLDGLIRKPETRYNMQMCKDVLRTDKLPG